MDTHPTPTKHLRSTTPVMAAPNSHAKLAELAEALRPASARLLGSNGVEVALPESVHQLLERIVEMLARGLAVTLVPVDKLLTTQQAADLLNVSRQYLVRLLEDGQLPFSKVGTHRRLKIEDVLKYKGRRDSDRRGKLAELTQLTEEAGGYDEK
jgi:excisionase family DNA binding protein